MKDQHLKEVLDFLNSIEGAGYGGMASFEVARAHVHHAFQEAWKPAHEREGLCAFPSTAGAKNTLQGD